MYHVDGIISQIADHSSRRQYTVVVVVVFIMNIVLIIHKNLKTNTEHKKSLNRLKSKQYKN